MKHFTAIIGLLALTITGCSSGGGSTNPIASTTNGFFRFVNGSADAGPVDVYVDGAKMNATPVGYGQITAYNKFSTGSHTIVLDVAGTSTAITGISSSALTQSVNGGQYVSLVLAGEQHPTGASDSLNLLAFNDLVFTTPSGGAAVDIRNASPAAGSTQFGYYYINTPSSSFPINSPVAVGSATEPFGMPSSALNASTAVGFYAGSATTMTITPSQFSTSCTANTLPCDVGNYSLYLIDGPAASSSPVAGPYPDSIGASSTAGLVGIVDANGT